MHEASQQVIDSVINWMEKFVEVPHPSFGNLPPCPYARKYRLQDKVKIVECPTNDYAVDIWMTANDVLREWDDTYEAVVVARKHPTRRHNTPEEVTKEIQLLNEEYKDRDLVCLEDHPDDEEYIDGIQMNHGGLILVVIQRLSKINKHTKMLQEGKYYDRWSKDNLDDVVTWRFEH